MRAAGGIFIVVALALLAAACGTSATKSVRDTRGGLVGRMTPACARDMAYLDRVARRQIRTMNRLEEDVDALRAESRPLRAAVSRAERRLVAARGARERARAPLERFLDAHPERELPAGLFADYRRLRAAERTASRGFALALEAANAAVKRLNVAIDRRNALLETMERTEDAADEGYDRARTLESRCLGRIAGWRVATASLERRVAPAARRAGSDGAFISCDSPSEWSLHLTGDDDEFEEYGYVYQGESTIHLSPRTCLGLARLVARPGGFGCVAANTRWQCPPSLEAAAIAVVTVAHEVQHVERIYDEAEAECNARQYAKIVGRGLGLPARVAGRLAAFTEDAVSQPDEYSSDECRQGGKLDLHLAGGWPAGF